MPPRRRGTAPAQSTLAFGTQSRVTKPSTTPTNLNKTKSPDSSVALRSDKPSSGTPEPQQLLARAEPAPHVADLAVRQQASAEHHEPSSAEDKRALELSFKDIQRYWRNEEQTRKAPRVHQQHLNLEEKILRHFDLSSQYGPCIGIPRIKRWRRANTLKLNPPLEVLYILLNGENLQEQAHMDTLLS